MKHLPHITLAVAMVCLTCGGACGEIILETENLRLEIANDGTVTKLFGNRQRDRAESTGRAVPFGHRVSRRRAV